jgi:hypothetical protein
MNILKKLFPPAYMHENPAKRIQAIKKINDTDLLKDISKTDEDEGVCKIAAARYFQLRKKMRQ